MNPFTIYKYPVAACLKITMLFVLFSSLFNLNAQAQQKPDTSSTNEIFSKVEQSGEYPGGMKALYAYMSKTIRYPALARENNVQGIVYVAFIIEKDGSLSNIAVMKGIGSGCDEEAVKVIKTSPKWNPGKKNGLPVRQQYVMPVSFKLMMPR